jgi:hypothetical protein
LGWSYIAYKGIAALEAVGASHVGWDREFHRVTVVASRRGGIHRLFVFLLFVVAGTSCVILSVVVGNGRSEVCCALLTASSRGDERRGVTPGGLHPLDVLLKFESQGSSRFLREERVSRGRRGSLGGRRCNGEWDGWGRRGNARRLGRGRCISGKSLFRSLRWLEDETLQCRVLLSLSAKAKVGLLLHEVVGRDNGGAASPGLELLRSRDGLAIDGGRGVDGDEDGLVGFEGRKEALVVVIARAGEATLLLGTFSEDEAEKHVKAADGEEEECSDKCELVDMVRENLCSDPE